MAWTAVHGVISRRCWRATLICWNVCQTPLLRVYFVATDQVRNRFRIDQCSLIRKLRVSAFGHICRRNPASKPLPFWPPPHIHHGAAQEDAHHSSGPTKSSKTPRCSWVMPWQQHGSCDANNLSKYLGICECSLRISSPDTVADTCSNACILRPGMSLNISWNSAL